MSAPDEIKTGEFVFKRDDAITLCRDWQEYIYSGERKNRVGDNVENLIEELCLAFGFTVADVRATWWRRRQCGTQHEWMDGARGQMCRKCGMLHSETV